MRTYNDLMDLMAQHLPGAEICTDNFGQLVIYTGKKVRAREDGVLEEFDPDLCSACDRPSLECSENPCDDVISDRNA